MPAVERDITPTGRVSVAELTASSRPEAVPEAKTTSLAPEVPTTSSVSPVASAQPEPQPAAQRLRTDIQKADTPEQAKELRIAIEGQKDTLGIDLFTELKNKAVQRYHQLNAMASINAQFDALSPDAENATAQFQKLSTLVQRSQRVLDPQEYQRFSMALLDIKADYARN